MLVRSMTIEEARLVLYKRIYGCNLGSEPPHPPDKNPANSPKDIPVPAKNEQEERLRPGRVAVRGEQLIRLETFLQAAQEAMLAMKAKLIAAKVPVPPVPDIAALGPAWQVYAARGRRALAAFGINEAV